MACRGRGRAACAARPPHTAVHTTNRGFLLHVRALLHALLPHPCAEHSNRPARAVVRDTVPRTSRGPARAGHCSLRPGPGGGPPGPGDPRRRRPVRSRARGQAGGRKGPRRKRARLCEPPEPDQPQGRRTRRRRLSTPPSRARAAALNPPPLSARPAETGQARSYQGRQRGPGSGPLGRVRARHFPTAGPGQSET